MFICLKLLGVNHYRGIWHSGQWVWHHQAPSPGTTLSISAQATRALNCVCEPLCSISIYFVCSLARCFSKVLIIASSLYTVSAYGMFLKNTLLLDSRGNLYSVSITRALILQMIKQVLKNLKNHREKPSGPARFKSPISLIHQRPKAFIQLLKMLQLHKNRQPRTLYIWGKSLMWKRGTKENWKMEFRKIKKKLKCLQRNRKKYWSKEQVQNVIF